MLLPILCKRYAGSTKRSEMFLGLDNMHRIGKRSQCFKFFSKYFSMVLGLAYPLTDELGEEH